MNRIILQGRFTKDPEMRKTTNGTSVISFSLAVDRKYKSQDGERQTDFIDCVAWKNTADFIGQYFTKGKQALVEGSLQIRSYEDKEGVKRRVSEVVVDSIYFCGSKSDNESSPTYTQPYSPAARSDYAPAESSDFTEIDDDDGDLPF